MIKRSITLRTLRLFECDQPFQKRLAKIGDPVMHIRVLALFALSLVLFVGPSWAQSCTGGEEGLSCTNTFSPGNTTGTFDFSGTGDGVITFQFETVLTTFHLTVTAVELTSITNLDPAEFPTGTVCITYTKGVCVRYDVTGDVGGPNGVPVRGVDYRGVISLTLNYNSFQTVDIPAFGHAPGDFSGAVFSEDILTFYVDPLACASTFGCDPAMGGKTPGISSLAALNKPFATSAQGDVVCNPGLTAVAQTSTSGNNPIVEVSFKLVASNCSTDPPLRDKTATLSVGTKELITGNIIPTALVNGGAANKFHFDNKNGVNIQDINTNGLPSGLYYVTVTSSLFSPVTTTFTIP
jgi:hypothetical protein